LHGGPSPAQGADTTSRSTPAHYSTSIGYTITRDAIFTRNRRPRKCMCYTLPRVQQTAPM